MSDVPVDTLREDGLESVCARAFDHIYECSRVEDDLHIPNRTSRRITRYGFCWTHICEVG